MQLLMMMNVTQGHDHGEAGESNASPVRRAGIATPSSPCTPKRYARNVTVSPLRHERCQVHVLTFFLATQTDAGVAAVWDDSDDPTLVHIRVNWDKRDGRGSTESQAHVSSVHISQQHNLSVSSCVITLAWLFAGTVS